MCIKKVVLFLKNVFKKENAVCACSQSKESERRKSKRLKVLVTYFLIGDNKEREASITKNVSTDGLCIISDRELSIGAAVSLEIDLYDDKPPIHAKGKIIWIKEAGMSLSSQKMDYELGIEFTDIADDSHQRIAQYVSIQGLTKY